MVRRDDGREEAEATMNGSENAATKHNPEQTDGEGTTAEPPYEQLMRRAQLEALVAAMRAARIHPDALLEAYDEAAKRNREEPIPRRAGSDGADDRSAETADRTSAFVHVVAAAGLSAMDVSEAAFLVMMMATKDMDDDIRMIMAEIKAMTAAKNKLRELINDLNRWISQEMSGHRGSENLDLEEVTGTSPGGLFEGSGSKITYNEPRPDTESPDLVADYEVTYNLGDGKVTVQGLKSLLDDLKGKLDGMNEMSEMTSLRLQMTMDRRSKFIATLSNIMKKISTTQDILVQNIK